MEVVGSSKGRDVRVRTASREYPTVQANAFTEDPTDDLRPEFVQKISRTMLLKRPRGRTRGCVLEAFLHAFLSEKSAGEAVRVVQGAGAKGRRAHGPRAMGLDQGRCGIYVGVAPYKPRRAGGNVESELTLALTREQEHGDDPLQLAEDRAQGDSEKPAAMALKGRLWMDLPSGTDLRAILPRTGASSSGLRVPVQLGVPRVVPTRLALEAAESRALSRGSGRGMPARVSPEIRASRACRAGDARRQAVDDGNRLVWEHLVLVRAGVEVHERARVVVGTGVLICPTTYMDAVARCLGRVLRPTSKNEFHESEFASGEEALGRKYWWRAKAMESTSGPSADIHVVCICGGDVEEGRVVRRRVLASPMRTQQFSSTQDDPASSFSAMREEGETSAKRSGTAEGGRQRNGDVDTCNISALRGSAGGLRLFAKLNWMQG
ncbi:hypothetical protein B0H13DRAFT_2292705 [Mycena leptocephala]|nr:hypothetical protein B0H13DRAFT_2292705 [Mycena leptocephala]